MSVCCECCVLSDIGLCEGADYLSRGVPLAHWGLLCHGKKNNVLSYLNSLSSIYRMQLQNTQLEQTQRKLSSRHSPFLNGESSSDVF